MRHFLHKLKNKLNEPKGFLSGFLWAALFIALCGVIFYILWGFDLLDSEKKVAWSAVFAAVGAALALFFAGHRNKQFGEQIDLQIRQRADDRFNTAISTLGSAQTSARSGAIYALYYLALEDEKYRNAIAQILCSHIRTFTAAEHYLEDHEDEPLAEIQTTIDLLFRGAQNPENSESASQPGLHVKFSDLPPANMQKAHLVGCNFRDAQLEKVNFTGANCQEANFRDANCQWATFWRANCQWANFWRANCQWANFERANCQGANFERANCQWAKFDGANRSGATFRDAKL